MLTRCVTGALAEELAQGGAFHLMAGQAVLNMTENLVVKTGTAVLFDGGGRTLKTSSFGFRVEANAKLCLYNIHLIDGTKSASKVDVQEPAHGAVVDMRWTTISGGRGEEKQVGFSGDEDVRGSGGRGGAVFVSGQATLNFYQCHFVGCGAVHTACMRIMPALTSFDLCRGLGVLFTWMVRLW